MRLLLYSQFIKTPEYYHHIQQKRMSHHQHLNQQKGMSQQAWVLKCKVCHSGSVKRVLRCVSKSLSRLNVLAKVSAANVSWSLCLLKHKLSFQITSKNLHMTFSLQCKLKWCFCMKIFLYLLGWYKSLHWFMQYFWVSLDFSNV